MSLSRLPSELQHEILVHLDGIALARAESVCKLWHEILTTQPFNSVWRRECLSNIEESVLVELTGIEDILVTELRRSWPITFDKSVNDNGMKTHVCVWKSVYKKWHTCKKVGKWPVMKSEIESKQGIQQGRRSGGGGGQDPPIICSA